MVLRVSGTYWTGTISHHALRWLWEFQLRLMSHRIVIHWIPYLIPSGVLEILPVCRSLYKSIYYLHMAGIKTKSRLELVAADLQSLLA